MRGVDLTLQALNLTGTRFANNGYSYRFQSPGYDPRGDVPGPRLEGGDQYVLLGFYPQARFQIMGGVRLTL